MIIYLIKKHALWIVLMANVSCNTQNKQQPDGGPCSYKITDYPAKILKIEDVGNNQVDLNLEINPFHFEKADTISFCLENHGRCVTIEELKENKLNQGDTIIYQIQEIKEGACNPRIIVIKAEKFKRSG